jgi:excisionase family DNA binding protein
MINHGTGRCVSFGGLKADRLVTEELLRRLDPVGVRAAVEAIDRRVHSEDERIAQKELALEQARFEVARARRQYDAVDPDNRLVAAELERRWNETLRRHEGIEEELRALRANPPEALSDAARCAVLQLGEDLPALWNHPQSTQQLKKRIVRTLLNEIIVRKENEKISMMLHWQGGDHTVLEFLKNKTGHHRHAAPENVVQLVRELARVQPDQGIVSILNRLGVRTGQGHNWTEGRLRAFRATHDIAVYVDGERLARGELTLEETADMLKTSLETVRRLIARKVLAARQACAGAPWVIKRDAVEKLAAKAALTSPSTENIDQLSLKLQ